MAGRQRNQHSRRPAKFKGARGSLIPGSGSDELQPQPEEHHVPELPVHILEEGPQTPAPAVRRAGLVDERRPHQRPGRHRGHPRGHHHNNNQQQRQQRQWKSSETSPARGQRREGLVDGQQLKRARGNPKAVGRAVKHLGLLRVVREVD